MQTLKAAIYQLNIVFGNKKQNLLKSRKIIEAAAKQNIDLLVFPELFTTGFAYNKFADIVEVGYNAPTFKQLINWSEEWQIGLAGSLLLRHKKEDGYNNVGFIISPSKGLEYIYTKVHLWGSEKEHFLPGSEIPDPILFEKKARIGLAICYDLRFPEVYRAMAVAGAEILITTAAWPQARVNHFNLLAQARALENTCYHLAANKTGMDLEPLNTKYNGSSRIVSPFGEVIAELGSEEAMIHAELSAEILTKARERIPVLRDRKFL